MDRLNQLIADAQALEAKSEQDRTAAFAAQCEAARAAVAAAFDGLWDELAPFADHGNAWTNNDQVTTWWTTIRAPGLAPFCAAVQNVNHMGNTAPFLVATTKPEPGWRHHTFGSLPEFLLECKRDGDEAAAKALTERLAELRRKLDGYDSQRAQTFIEAEVTLAELLDLDPAGTEAWRALRESWQTWRNQKDAERAEEEALKERRAAAATEYEQAYTAYYADLQRMMATNAARLDEFQKDLDDPFPTWELTYGIAGQNEDGDRFADTASAHVLADGPDQDGYWATIQGRAVVRKRFYNIVSLVAQIERRPSVDDDLCPYVAVGAPGDHYWRKIYFHPAGDRERIKTRALMAIEPWPVAPELPEDLTANVVESIRRKVVGVGDGAEYDIPF